MTRSAGWVVPVGIVGILVLASKIGWSGIRGLGVLILVAFVVYKIAKASQEEQRVKEIQEANKKTAEAYQQVSQQLEALADDFVATAPHTREETLQAWEQYNCMVASLGLTRKDETYPHYHFYCDVIYPSYQKLGDDSLKMITKLQDFYYEIAFAYALPQAEQEALVRYMLRLFRYTFKEAVGDEDSHYRGLFPEDYDWANWNRRCIALLEEGCRKDFVMAISYLADCYYNCQVVRQRDYDKALELYTKAARMDDMEAVYMMGQCYENGNGTKRNYQKAGDCYQYAFDNGKNYGCGAALDALYTEHKWDKNRYNPDIFTNDLKKMNKQNLLQLQEGVEKYARTDLDTTEPKIVAIFLRTVLEQIVDSFVGCYEPTAMNDRLDEKISLLRNKGYFTKEIAAKAHSVRLVGNRGAHNDGGECITPEELRSCLTDIRQVMEYYAAY